MQERIICSGFGGQGIMVLGRLISQAAMIQGKHTTWIPAYGAEVRGGAAYCMVIISDDEIASPFVKEADTLIALNEPSLEKFKGRVTGGGLIIMNKSLISRDFKKDNLKIISAPFTGLAIKLGNVKVTNVIALGSYLNAKKVLSVKSVEEAMQEMAPKDRPELLQINQRALSLGIEIVK